MTAVAAATAFASGLSVAFRQLIASATLSAAKFSPKPKFCAAARSPSADTGDLGHEFFDAAFSRFGVMFFSDPVAAFANIRASLK